MLNISASPHVRHQDSTPSVMRDVALALLPAALASAYFFGVGSWLVIMVSVASCIVFEALSQLVMKRPQTIRDWSAVVTGLLLAFNLPADIPLWMPVVGAFFAIVVIKQAFGGLGKNFLNPALGARVIMAIAFPVQMNSHVIKESFAGKSFLSSLDLMSQATPLAAVRMANDPDAISSATQVITYDYKQLFLGYKPGMLGEVCILALAIGAIYLLSRKVIDLYIPLSYIATALIFVTLAGEDPLYHLLSGGLFLGAFFMATDYVTNPASRMGHIIFGIGCGLLTGLMRIYGASPEGVSFSILLMNILTPHIDQLTVFRPRRRKARLNLVPAERK